MKIGKYAYIIWAISLLAGIFWADGKSLAAEDTLINAPEENGAHIEGSGTQLSPGTLIMLPDGEKTIIESVMPDGNFQTESGLVILPDGSVANSEARVEILLPGGGASNFAPGSQVIFPDGATARIEEKLPNGDWKTSLGVNLAPDGTIRGVGGKAQAIARVAPKAQDGTPGEKAAIKPLPDAEKSVGQEKVKVAVPTGKIPENSQQKAPASAAQEKGSEEARLTLAELLPLTNVGKSEKGKMPPEEAKRQGTPDKGAKTAAGRTSEPQKKSAPPVVGGKEAPEKKQSAKAPEKKPEPEKKVAKTPVGKELRIPPEAARSGNLSFLEGCWQGTRPEYYSKRTIRECFCFGANGSNGKRRVYDPLGSRMCIGATKAHLASNGVLSVTSSGAACNDGERWGQAEMECRNSGPRTPCSWIFKDANNGRQAYQIPFVRVESCGR